MIGLIKALAVAVAIAILVYILAIFVGGLLILTGIPLAAYVGKFLEQYATLLSIIAFIFALAGGVSFSNPFAK